MDHPAWCTHHNRFSDGSDDWHESRTVELHGFEFYVSSGTLSGRPELFIPVHGCRDGMPLEEAEEVTRAILELVKAAKA